MPDTDEWRDLSDSELISRLVQRGVPEGHVEHVVEHRELEWAADAITQWMTW